MAVSFRSVDRSVGSVYAIVSRERPIPGGKLTDSVRALVLAQCRGRGAQDVLVMHAGTVPGEGFEGGRKAPFPHAKSGQVCSTLAKRSFTVVPGRAQSRYR